MSVVTTRDVVFSFNDSCNCWSRCCHPSEDKRIYVNSAGVLETYKENKARHDTERAFERSISHLNATMERKITSFQGNPEEFQQKVSSILESIYSLKEINLNHIEAINDLMLQHMHERSPRLERIETKEVEPESNRCAIL